ncbi:MAG: heavy metal translocating P-type ATPase metal-binding domain-containing protein [Bacteroidota bacterium]
MSTFSSSPRPAVDPPSEREPVSCYHCGDSCQNHLHQIEEKVFCCEGCKMVYQLLSENGLCTFYELEPSPGGSLKARKDDQAFAYLDNPEIESRLLQFKEQGMAKVSFYLPQIHCSSCIWLLENLYQLREGFFQSRVDFLKKELHLNFDPEQLSLREVVALLSSLGYEPEINLQDLESPQRRPSDRRLIYQLGVAGFAFGNIMLMSFPEYLGLEADLFPNFRQFFGYLNLLLALPVLLYSAQSFFLSAWRGLKEQFLNIDVPISLGILALFLRSSYEVLFQTGMGYFDSLAGLVFFLLVGRWFQNKTYARIAFDRDYKSYFPISTTRMIGGKEESTPITELNPGDSILVRNRELIPADALLLSPEAQIDYSFVTGEATPVKKQAGDLIYAGGSQIGAAIELTLVKNVSQSYLTQLWNHQTFQKAHQSSLTQFIDRIGQRFTLAVLSLATLAGLYWWYQSSFGMAVNVFTAVLIVACPCALALSSPIILGNMMRILGRWGFYVKNTRVLEQLSQITHLVFDKTGTLTPKTQESQVQFEGELDAYEKELVAALVKHSTHPMSRAIDHYLDIRTDLQVAQFRETDGKGIQGEISGHHLQIGKGSWLPAGITKPTSPLPSPSGSWVLIDGKLKGKFWMAQQFRAGLKEVIQAFRADYQLSLLSGDHEQAREGIRPYFPAGTELRFEQSPLDKLHYIERLQADGEQVMMLGDGLNDAGALKASEVGVAITEQVDAFSPACDVIATAQQFHRLPALLRAAFTSMRLVKGGLVLSLAYNLIGLSIAVQGLLSPLVAAILMPLSSLTVVLYGMLTTEWVGKKLGTR